MESYASTSSYHVINRAAEDDHVDVDSDDDPMVDPATGQKILRPRNAWILYRKTRLNDVAPLSDGSRQPMAKASSIISSWWKNETKEVRRKFEMLAAQEKAEHKRRYPDYKYKPRTSQQIAKAKEKKKVTKKIMQAKEKEKDKKPKVQEQTPPLTLSSSVHTSYIEAALAHQAAMQASYQHGAEGPSPPLSLASTPITTPSTLPTSEFEQGSSSTTATSSRATSSPVDVLGLALAPPSFNFQGRQAALRAPRHLPARISPRSKGGRQVSISSTASRVPSSSTLTPSPATSTPLSPLEWPLPMLSSRLTSPESADDSPTTDLVTPSTSAELSWCEDSSTSNEDQLGSVSIDVDLASFTNEAFSDIAYFTSMGLPGLDAEGVFQVPADSFLEAAPGQININLPYCEPSEQDHERFKAILNEFDFSPFQEDDGMGPTAPDTSAWEQWGAMHHNAQHTDSPFAQGGEEHADASMGLGIDAQMPQMSTPPYDPEEAPRVLEDIHESSEVTVHVEEASSPVDVLQQTLPSLTLSADVLADPDFQALWVRYVEQKHIQNQQQVVPTQQASHLQPQYTHETRQEHMAHPQQQLESHYARQEAQSALYDTSEYDNQQRAYAESTQSEPATPATATEAICANRWMPPAGAMHSRVRRVAGSWRPPAAQQEAWSAPQTPVDGSSWGGTSN